MAIANLIKFTMWRTYLVDSYNTKMVCFGEEAIELYMCEKAIFFLPVNILMLAFLATRHTTVCLDNKPKPICTENLHHMILYHVINYLG